MLISFDYLFEKYSIKTKTVLHLGANTGQEAAAYSVHGVETVIWVEALPAVHAKLAKHVAQFPSVQIALQACLSDVDGQDVTFNVASNDAQSSSFLEFGTHSKEHPTVRFVDRLQMKTKRLDTLLAEHGLDLPWPGGSFLNIDLQGAELLALKGMGDLLHRFQYAYVEVNEKELYKGCPLTKDIDAYLARFGFVGVETKMTGSGWGDKFYIKQA